MGFKNKVGFLTSASMVASVMAIAFPAAAKAAEAENSEGTIIVTARRAEENIQDVPISIQVFSQESLTQQNVTSAADLGNLAPGLVTNSKFGTDNTTFSVRGFFQELRTTASVAIYFADVVAQRAASSTASGDGAGPGDFFDLQNVQVLKGPQGTLFGRNTTGGAVLLVPNKPTDKFEGYVEGTYGNYDQRRVQAVINAPLGDMARLRVGADWNKRDGYLRNISGIGPNRFANTNYIALRASLVLDLSPDIENYTIATYSKSKNRGFVGHMEAAIPGVGIGDLTARQLAQEAILNPSGSVYAISNSQPDAMKQLQQWRVINTTTWRATDAITVKNIVSYGQIRNRALFDPFGTVGTLGPTYSNFRSGLVNVPTGAFQGLLIPFAMIRSVPGGYQADQENFTEELQIQGESAGGRLNWQAGFYYEKSNARSPAGTAGASQIACTGDPTNFQCVDPIGTLAGRPGAGGAVNWQTAESDFRNIGIYAQGSYDLTDWLTFTGGLRYTWDKTASEFWQYGIRFPAPNTPFIDCLDFASGQVLTKADILNRNVCGQSATVSTKAPTWAASLEIKPNQSIMMFIKYSRGYRQGSTNPFSLPGFKTFADEKVDVYEAGFRLSGDVLAGPAYFNVTGYYNDFSNQQVQAGAIVPGLAPNAIIINAGASRMYGVELEGSIQPVEGLRLGVNYGYLNTRLKSLTLPGTPTPTGLPVPPGTTVLPNGTLIFPTSTAGTTLPLSPKHSLNLSAQYTLPLDETVGKVSFGVTYSYMSEQFFNANRGAFPNSRFNPRNIVNANLSWSGIGGSPVDASIFATNLFKDKYVILVNDNLSTGNFSRNYGEPRMYGIRLRYNFGER